MLNPTEVKLVKVGSLNAAFRKNANQKIALTISALYHAVVHGNVAFADDWQRSDATMLDAVLRPLFPMIIRCAFGQVPELCAGLVKQGVQFTCAETSAGCWRITLIGGY